MHYLWMTAVGIASIFVFLYVRTIIKLMRLRQRIYNYHSAKALEGLCVDKELVEKKKSMEALNAYREAGEIGFCGLIVLLVGGYPASRLINKFKRYQSTPTESSFSTALIFSFLNETLLKTSNSKDWNDYFEKLVKNPDVSSNLLCICFFVVAGLANNWHKCVLQPKHMNDVLLPFGLAIDNIKVWKRELGERSSWRTEILSRVVKNIWKSNETCTLK